MSEVNSIEGGGGGSFRPVGLGAVVFLLSLSLMMVYLSTMQPSPYYNVDFLKGSDPYNYFSWALDIYNGGLIGHGRFNQSPLYAYFLALTFKAAGGGHLLIPRFFQAIMGSCTALIVFIMARDFRGDLAGLAAGLLVSLHGCLVFYEASFMRTGLVVFTNTLLVFLMLRAQKKPGALIGLCCGASFGLALLAKPNIAVMIATVPFWVWLAKNDAGLKKASLMGAAVLVGFLIAMAPVAVRNMRAGVPILSITMRGPYEFFAGNHPGMPPNLWQPNAEVADMTNRSGDSLVKAVGMVLEYYRDKPLKLVEKEADKARTFLSGFESPNSISYYVEKRYVPIIRMLPVTWSVVLGMSLVGLWLTRGDLRDQFPLTAYILLYSTATIAFYVLARFRLPVVPALSVFAGAAVSETVDRARSGRRATAAAAIAAAVLIALAAWPRGDDPITPTDYQNLVRFHMIEDEPIRAREWADEGLANARELAATRGDAWSHYRLARLLFLSGRPLDEVEAELDSAKRAGPSDWLSWFITAMELECQKRRTGKDFKPSGYRIL